MLRRLLFRFRVEEAIALAFLLPTTWLTLAAYVYAREAGVLGARYPGGVVRLGVAVVGLRGRGGTHLGVYAGRPDTRVLYVCDPDRSVVAKKKPLQRRGLLE